VRRCLRDAASWHARAPRDVLIVRGVGAAVGAFGPPGCFRRLKGGALVARRTGAYMIASW
jgi:hypothetical protein